MITSAENVPESEFSAEDAFDLDVQFSPSQNVAAISSSNTDPGCGTCGSSCGGTCSGQTCYGC